MGILDHNSVFTSMLQSSLFAVGDAVPLSHPFSESTKAWVRRHCRDSRNVAKYRAVRNQIFDFLDVDNFGEIIGLLHSHDLRRQRTERAYTLLGNMFGLKGNHDEIAGRVHEYARIADTVIDYLRHKVLAPFASYVETTNEIETTSNPVDLLLTVFDDRFHKKARFEAKRKLVLMNLAGSIEQRERETDIESKFSDFLDFLNDYVWSPSLKIGELEIVHLLSEHEPNTYHCTRVEVLQDQDAGTIRPTPGQKLTLIKRRRFRHEGRDYPIYVSVRKKQPETKVLKLLRKNEKNPAVAVDDELGLMAVLDNVAEIKNFQRHLTRSAVRADSFMTLEDISDTLTGGHYESNATGSSSKTRMLKFFARLGGMRVEFIIHTNQTYLDYMYQREVAHDEYEVKRIFDTGVAELLFPPDIYHLDIDRIRDHQLAWFRKRIEDA